MKWLLLLWALDGPEIRGVFHSEAMCRAVVRHELAAEAAPIRFCVPMQLDNLVYDVVLYPNETQTEIRTIEGNR